jgi:hypothetical protein
MTAILDWTVFLSFWASILYVAAYTFFAVSNLPNNPPRKSSIAVVALMGAWAAFFLAADGIERLVQVITNDRYLAFYVGEFTGFGVGSYVGVAVDEVLQELWPEKRVEPPISQQERVMSAPTIKPASRDQALTLSTMQTAVAVRTPRTGIENARSIRNPVSAWINTISTKSRLTALANAEQLAKATAKAADAEAGGIEALMRRADRISELDVRQLFETDTRASQMAEQQHKLQLARTRRQAEALEAERKLLDAKHGVQATKKFKPMKFALGQARLDARIADSQVEVAVARAAGGGEVGSPIDALARETEQFLEQWLADGKDVADIRALLKKIREKQAGDAAQPKRSGG